MKTTSWCIIAAAAITILAAASHAPAYLTMTAAALTAGATVVALAEEMKSAHEDLSFTQRSCGTDRRQSPNFGPL